MIFFERTPKFAKRLKTSPLRGDKDFVKTAVFIFFRLDFSEAKSTPNDLVRKIDVSRKSFVFVGIS